MSNLQDGIAAFKSGNKDEARRCFIIAMKEDPNNENVWSWLYQVTKNDKEKIDCLNKIISINPANEKARQALDRLLAPPAPAPKMTNIVSPVPKPPIITTASKIETKKPDPIQQRNMLIGIGSIVLVCFICICAYSVYDPPATPKDHKTMSFIICQLYIEDMLKAPSTADFPSSSSSNIRDLGNNIFEMNSYVDAQNSFGAMIRTNWYCKIQYTGTEEDEDSDASLWNLLDIKLLE